MQSGLITKRLMRRGNLEFAIHWIKNSDILAMI